MNVSDWTKAKELKKGNKIVPFVGAGLSRLLGLPDSDRLVEIIAKELEWDPSLLRLAGELPQLAEYYKDMKHGIGPLRSLLDREFYRTNEQIRQSRAHMALVDCKFPVIYTTNFDDLIERAHAIKSVPCRAIADLVDLSEASVGETQVVKFHGTFSNDASLVLDESSYLDRLELESPLDIRFRSDILGKTIMFIGYRLRDINIRFLTHKLFKLRQSQNREFQDQPMAIMVTHAANDVQRLLWMKRDVRLIELDPIKREESLADFLEYLR
jgi:hypothetical protein